MHRPVSSVDDELVDVPRLRQAAPAAPRARSGEAAESPTALGRLGRRLALKPYGDELLTRSGDFWIFSARLIIFAMAAAEALAWGYMGALMSRSYPLVAAVIAGVFVFTLIWVIDASFMTLDLARGHYERLLSGKRESLTTERLKLAGGILARVGIVSASLFITAPFLAQAIFSGDVQDEMTRRNAGAIAAKRGEIEQPYLARLGELRREQSVLEEQRVKEAAGTGLSGKYGRGPALETIERQLQDKRSEIAALEAARTEALTRFDGLSAAQLEQQYGLRFLSPGVSASSELLGAMLSNPQFGRAELAVRAFLGFLFLGLLILKAFQPRSVAIYFNEQLHSLFDQYRRGLFDTYLPEAERATAGGGMEPLRFEDWCVSTYAVIRKEDQRRRETGREQGMHELFLEQWQRLESSARRELDPLTQHYEATLAATDALEAELHNARSSVAAEEAELQKAESAYQSMRKHLDGGKLDGPTFEQAIAATKDLEERLRTLTLNVANSRRTIESCEQRLALRRQESTKLQEEIAEKQEVIADAEKRIAQERLKLAERIGEQRKAWAGEAG